MLFNTQNKYLDFFLRAVIGITIGMIFAVALSELSYASLSNRESVSREPRRVDLVIPFGTAEQVADGIYNRSLPSDLALVEGDILVVKNEDVVDHQLGPIWVPAGTSGVLELNTANQYTYECTFQPTRFQGIQVSPRVDSGLRVQGALAIGLPTGMMLAVYSYLIPGRKPAAST